MTAAGRPARQRNTWQRGAILRAVAAAACHITAEDVHRRLRGGPRPIGLATVYRALDGFVRDGLIESVHVGDGKMRYGLAAKHHDHVVCLTCGAWQPLDACLVTALPRRLAGFEIAGHRLELYGYCARCWRAGARARPTSRPDRARRRGERRPQT